MIDYWQLLINHYCNELRISKNFCVIRDPDQLQTMSINMPLQTCLHNNRMKTFLIEEVFGRFSRFKYGDISPINKCKMLKHTKFHFDFCFFFFIYSSSLGRCASSGTKLYVRAWHTFTISFEMVDR